MTSPITPSFSSQELSKAVEDARGVLEGIDEARNRVSNDIKTLEAYLQSLDLRTSFRLPLGMSLVAEDDQYVAASLEYSGSASGEIHEAALVWDQDAHGKFRLMYELSRWEGYVDVDVPGGPYFCEHDTLRREVKPLIETKFEIRKAMYRQLPRFINTLAAQLNVGQPFQPLKDEEVPF